MGTQVLGPPLTPEGPEGSFPPSLQCGRMARPGDTVSCSHDQGIAAPGCRAEVPQVDTMQARGGTGGSSAHMPPAACGAIACALCTTGLVVLFVAAAGCRTLGLSGGSTSSCCSWAAVSRENNTTGQNC